MLGRIAASVGLAIFAGIAVSLRDLVLPPPRQIPLPLEDMVLLGWLLSLMVIGWVTAQLIDRPVRFVVAPAAALLAVGVALVARQFRFPGALLTGDGFEILIWVWAVIALTAASLRWLSSVPRAVAPTGGGDRRGIPGGRGCDRRRAVRLGAIATATR
jgi:hypothetical protein